MIKHHLSVFALVCTLVLVACTAGAGAAQLRYTFTGSGSGSFAGEAFADRAFAIVGVADPSSRAACAVDDCVYLDLSSAVVRLQGLGDFELATLLRVYSTLGNLGLARGGPSGLDLYNGFTVAADYDFSSPIGPTAAFASLLQWDREDVLTTAGVLRFDSADNDGTFRAEGVPLPASAGLLGSALLLVRLRRRRPG